MIEEWRVVLGGDYEVSLTGRVRRLRGGKGTRAGKELTRFVATTGYLVVNVRVAKASKVIHVHALVAEAFIGPRPRGAQINHIDGAKTNNDPSNLEYVSQAENAAHAGRMGLVRSGERHSNAKLSDAQVSEIRVRRANGEGPCSLARAFGVASSTISQIANGQRRVS